jgi:hypothetical protein
MRRIALLSAGEEMFGRGVIGVMEGQNENAYRGIGGDGGVHGSG